MILMYFIVNYKDIVDCIVLEDLIEILLVFFNLDVFEVDVGFVGIDFRLCSFMIFFRLIRLSFVIIEFILCVGVV